LKISKKLLQLSNKNPKSGKRSSSTRPSLNHSNTPQPPKWAKDMNSHFSKKIKKKKKTYKWPTGVCVCVRA
jgi:hypothetical protein